MRERAAEILRGADLVRSGGVVLVPTETFYALAADPFQEEAVRRIFTIKRRAEDKPIPLIAADRATVDALAPDAPPVARMLMDRFWPGSLTILLRPARPLSRLITGQSGLIGVRVPPPCPARSLAACVGGWITATSANLSGEQDPDRVAQVVQEIRRGVDFILDLGPSPGAKPSTVIEPLEVGARIIREGAISAAQIVDFLSGAHLSDTVVV